MLTLENIIMFHQLKEVGLYVGTKESFSYHSTWLQNDVLNAIETTYKNWKS